MANELQARIHNGECTHTLVSALNVLRGTDFTKMMGSGILIKLTPITPDRYITDEFMVRAEDLEKIKPAVIQSLIDQLDLRRMLLLGEIKDIETALGAK